MVVMSVLKAGSPYVPLDADLPEERATFMVEDCGAPILVTRDGLDARLSVKQPLRVVHMDRGWHTKLKSSRKALEPVSPDSLAYIMYTSGCAALAQLCMPMACPILPSY